MIVLVVLLSASLVGETSGVHKPGQISPSPCHLLDDTEQVAQMAALQLRLAQLCGSDMPRDLPRAASAPLAGRRWWPQTLDGEETTADEVLANAPGGDIGGFSHTQSTTAIAASGDAGVLCVAYNDSYHLLVEGNGFTGFSRSLDGGVSFEDRGALAPTSFGDPSLAWNRNDGRFYLTTLEAGGVGLWRSDDCVNFTFLGNPSASGGEDRVVLVVDNGLDSPYDGRLYLAWTDFTAAGRVLASHSQDGGLSWSVPVALSTPGTDVQAPALAVAPDGKLFVAWLRWRPFPDGPIDIELVRSLDGGQTFNPVTSPMTGATNPRDAGASAVCGRPALAGNLRYTPAPRIAISPDGVLHAVYSYDPDGHDLGDTVDVFYRRSLDGGMSWETEQSLADDVSGHDQLSPSLAVGASGQVSATWYDRRLDPANRLLDTYFRRSLDGGASWQPVIRLTSASSPIYLDPFLAGCYHGDYDQQIQTASTIHVVWSDDRKVQDGHNDSDVRASALPLSDDFLLVPNDALLKVCAPDDVTIDLDLLSFGGFAEPVALSVLGAPDGATTSFDPNPVPLPGSSMLTLGDTDLASPGTYPLEVIGVSTPSNLTHRAFLNLALFSAPPAAPVGIDPPPEATGVDFEPQLEWAVSIEAETYVVEISTDNTFGDIVYSATSTTNRHAVVGRLAPLTTYFWRLTAANFCGQSSPSPPQRFTTRAAAPFLLVDDDDDDPNVREDYALALSGLGWAADIWDTGNSDQEPDPEVLGLYDFVLWFTGDAFETSTGPGSEGEEALAAWLDDGGRCLLLSSQDYFGNRGLTPFMENHLGIASVTDDSGQSQIVGQGAFSGLGPYTLSYPSLNASDTVTPTSSAEIAFSGDLGGAAVHLRTPLFQTFFLAFPFEAIPTPTDRRQVMLHLLDRCGVGAVFRDGFEIGDTSLWSTAVGFLHLLAEDWPQ